VLFRQIASGYTSTKPICLRSTEAPAPRYGQRILIFSNTMDTWVRLIRNLFRQRILSARDFRKHEWNGTPGVGRRKAGPSFEGKRQAGIRWAGVDRFIGLRLYGHVRALIQE